MIITQTPLRISFLGGGTDYPEYFEKQAGRCWAARSTSRPIFSISQFYSKMFDYSIRIAYRKVECVSSIEELEHAPFRECLRLGGRDCKTSRSATRRSCRRSPGLGSSSSFVVGLLNTLYAFRRRLVPRLDLAYEAIDLERNVLKESVGCQDQTFAAVGGFNMIEFRGMGNFAVHRVPFTPSRLEEFEDHLLVFFTGIKRKAEELAARQVQRSAAIGRHLKEMRRLVDQGYEIISGGGSLAAFGELLHRSWELKRQLDQAISSDYHRRNVSGRTGSRGDGRQAAGSRRRRLPAVLRSSRTASGRRVAPGRTISASIFASTSRDRRSSISDLTGTDGRGPRPGRRYERGGNRWRNVRSSSWRAVWGTAFRRCLRSPQGARHRSAIDRSSKSRSRCCAIRERGSSCSVSATGPPRSTIAWEMALAWASISNTRLNLSSYWAPAAALRLPSGFSSRRLLVLNGDTYLATDSSRILAITSTRGRPRRSRRP